MDGAVAWATENIPLVPADYTLWPQVGGDEQLVAEFAECPDKLCVVERAIDRLKRVAVLPVRVVGCRYAHCPEPVVAQRSIDKVALAHIRAIEPATALVEIQWAGYSAACYSSEDGRYPSVDSVVAGVQCVFDALAPHARARCSLDSSCPRTLFVTVSIGNAKPLKGVPLAAANTLVPALLRALQAMAAIVTAPFFGGEMPATRRLPVEIQDMWNTFVQKYGPAGAAQLWGAVYIAELGKCAQSTLRRSKTRPSAHLNAVVGAQAAAALFA